MVSLQSAHGGYELQNAGIEVLPAGTIVDGVMAKREVISDAIMKIGDSQRIKEERVAASVSGHSVIVKKITLPVKSPEEVRESIQWEAEQYIPFDISEVYLDYHVLGPNAQGNQTDVILVAAKRETIDDHTDVITLAGRNPLIVDIDAFALHNVYEVNYEPEADTVVALLNMGASILNVNMAKGSEFVSYARYRYGRERLHRVPAARSRYFARGSGEVQTRGCSGGSEDDCQLGAASVSEILTLEVQKTFDYFRTAAQFEEIQAILVCGGASRTQGLRGYLEEQFQVPVNFLNPFEGVSVDRDHFPTSLGENQGSDFAVAVGLALRYPGDKARQSGSAASGGLVRLFKKLTGRAP